MNCRYIGRAIGFSLSWLMVSLPVLAQSTFRLTSPTYLCSSGFIAFNTTGGDGTTIMYSTTGISSSSPTSDTGVVVDTYRTVPAAGPIVIEASQSGIVSRFELDVPSYCSRTFLYPVRRAPIPDVTVFANETMPLLNVGQYFRSNDIGYEYRATFSYKVYGLPPGITVNTQAGKPPGTMGFDTAFAYLTGTPTLAGRFPVTIVATNQGAFTDAYSVADTFNLTAVDKALPVALVSFTAKPLVDQTIQLNWTTSLERDHKSFLIERSRDLIYFEIVGEVSSQETNQQAVKSYQLLDVTPYWGTSYYRLTQIDITGKYTRFPMISVALRDSPYQVRPNPVWRFDQFVVLLDEPDLAKINLYGANGSSVPFRKTATNHQSVTLKLGDSSPVGLYILTVEERGQTRQYRLLIE